MRSEIHTKDQRMIFSESNKEKKRYVSDLARESTLRGHGMSNFEVRISTVMSLLDS